MWNIDENYEENQQNYQIWVVMIFFLFLRLCSSLIDKFISKIFIVNMYFINTQNILDTR